MTDKKHGHVHHSRSSKDILSADRILSAAGLKRDDVFMDAGCGDGYISIAASPMVGDGGRVYAIDVYPESIEIVKNEIKNRDLANVTAIIADLTREVPLNNDSVDLCVMANVLHGFVENNEVQKVIPEIIRVLKTNGVFAVVEFKKIEGSPGPPFNIRLDPDNVENILSEYGFKIADTVEVGKYHYLVKALKK